MSAGLARFRSDFQGRRWCHLARRLLTKEAPAAARTPARPDPAAVEDRWRKGGGWVEEERSAVAPAGGGSVVAARESASMMTPWSGGAPTCPRRGDP